MTKELLPLTLRLFGAPEIQTHSEPWVLKNQKALALLFYLVVTGQPHTRSHLATLLWSEFPAVNARQSLRATLFQLRQQLQAVDLGQLLVNEGELLRLPLSPEACDVTAFRRLLVEGDAPAWQKAIALYRGPLLEGFVLPDTPLFDEWLRLEDEKLSQAYLTTLRKLADDAAAQQKWDQAFPYLRELVQADPLAEDAQQQLIRLYLQTGAIGQALRQYQQFAETLREKLGLKPTTETQVLFQEGLRRQLPLASHPPRTASPQSALPFVGREKLLTQMVAISQQIRTGKGSTLLLQGEGGIGKTRLLGEFFDRLTADNPPWLVLQGGCSPFDDLISYGPFLEAFQDTPLGDLTDQLLAPHTDAPAARDQFIYRILQTLRHLSQNAPLVLAIDDLQWANRSTLNLFGLLATRLHQLPLLLIGTVQRPEAIPALQRLITVERRRGQLQVFPLPPLTEGAITELLRQIGVSPSSIPMLTKWLQVRSEGNPFILDEMVAQLQSDGILARVGEQWQIDPGPWLRWRATYTLPETTHDLVSWRLRNLTEAAYSLLEIFAVAGQPLPLALLTDFSGISVQKLLPLLEELSGRGLLIESGRDLFVLSHYLVRETVLHHLSHVRRRLIHAQLAQLLAQCPALAAHFPLWAVARHAVAGEDVALARHYGLQILTNLPQDYTGAETVDFLQHLYDLLVPSAPSTEMMRLARVIGSIQQSLGHLPEALHWQQQYLTLAREVGDLTAQATAYLEQGELALVSNDVVAATAAAESGLSLCATLPETDPALPRLAGRGHRLLGHALAMEGDDLPQAKRHLLQATAVHRLTKNPRDLCASLFELGNVAAQQGELLPALELYEEAAQVAEGGQAHYMHTLARNNLAYHNLLLGRLKAAQQALMQGQRLAETYELLGALLHLSSTQGEIGLYLADWQAARQSFHQGLSLAEELGNLERQAGCRAGLALAARGQQDLNGALALLDEALLLISGHGYWHLRTRLLIWLAQTLMQAERWDEARPHLTTALETAQRHDRVLLLLEAERLQATLAAADGSWTQAELCFHDNLVRATKLNLSLEIARTQAAWGQAVLRFAPSTDEGYTLLRQAHQVFMVHQAQAELILLYDSAENNA